MKKRLLFVTGGCDIVLFRMNIGWITEAMEERGVFQVDHIDCGHQDLSPLIPEYDVIVYYRLISQTNSAIDLANSLNKVTCYLIDDFLLEQEYGPNIVYLMNKVDYVVTSTPLLRQLYESSGINKSFYVKRDGIPVKKLLPYKSENQVNTGNFRLAWLGGCAHKTSIFFNSIIEVMTILSNRKRGVHLICFGKPADFANTISSLPFISIDNLAFIPFYDEARYYMTISNLAIDAVICRVPYDNLSLGKAEAKFMEAGLYAIPLVCSRYGIYKEVIEEGVTGLLADSGEEFADKIMLLMDNPTLKNNLGKNAHNKVVKEYDIEKRAREFEEFLLQCLNEKRN